MQRNKYSHRAKMFSFLSNLKCFYLTRFGQIVDCSLLQHRGIILFLWRCDQDL